MAEPGSEPVGGTAVDTERPGLKRGLGRLEATTIVVGGIIGSGIFVVPSLVAREVGAPGLSLAVWVLAGLVALCGALCYAELSASVPETGGTYAYLRRAYRRPVIGFLFAWTMIFCMAPGAIAAVATAFAHYAGYFLGQLFPYGTWEQRVVAVTAILLLAGANYLGVRFGGGLQNVLTALKVLALLSIVVLGFALGDGELGHYRPLLPPDADLPLMALVGTALIPALFAYSGWTFSAYVAGEIRSPQRNLPASIIGGIGIVIAIYLLVNLAYMYALPFPELRESDVVAADAMLAAIGPLGAAFIALVVMISTFGSANAQVLSYPRIAYAASRDGLFFRSLGEVHPRFRAPGNAIIVQAAVAAVFALSGTYLEILTYFAFVDYLFFTLAIAGVFVLRWREPELHRPYRVWGYPFTPLIFLGIVGWYLTNILIHRTGPSMVGVAMMLVGVPFYLFWSRRLRSEAP